MTGIQKWNASLRRFPFPLRMSAAQSAGSQRLFSGVSNTNVSSLSLQKIVLHIEQREKSACTSCRNDVTVAPREQPTEVVRKVGASLLAKLVAEKASISLPIDRQRRQLRTMGLDFPCNTLQSYWGYTADLLAPIAEKNRERC